MEQGKPPANPDDYRYLCRDASGELIAGIRPDGTIEWSKDKNRAHAFQETLIHSIGMLYHQNVHLNNKLDLLIRAQGLNPSPVKIIGE